MFIHEGKNENYYFTIPCWQWPIITLFLGASYLSLGTKGLINCCVWIIGMLALKYVLFKCFFLMKGHEQKNGLNVPLLAVSLAAAFFVYIASDYADKPQTSKHVAPVYYHALSYGD